MILYIGALITLAVGLFCGKFGSRRSVGLAATMAWSLMPIITVLEGPETYAVVNLLEMAFFTLGLGCGMIKWEN